MQPEDSPITVLLVDDHVLVAEGLSALLNASGDIRVVGTADSADAAIRFAEQTRPQVVIMDSHLADSSGADVAMRLRERVGHLPIVFLSADDSERAMIAAVGAGACAYLLKSRASLDVVDAVRRAAAGEMLIAAPLLARLLARSQELAKESAEQRRLRESLTPRELEVLGLMAEGLDNRTIAQELGIGFTTVRGHVQNILEKLDAHSKLEALACAARYGLLDAA